MEQAIDAYVHQHLREHAKRPEKAEKLFRWGMNKYAADLLPKRMEEIRHEDVTKLHRKLGGQPPRTANLVVKQLRTVFNFCRKARLYVGENPARDTKFYHEPKRARFLQPNELPKLWAALSASKNHDLRDYVNVALWTGARKMDVLSMRWQDVSLDDNRWTVPDPKARTPYVIPLTKESVDILKDRLRRREFESPWVFPSVASASGHIADMKRAWHQLLEDAGLAYPGAPELRLRQHDLRRTQGSWQAAQGTSLQIIGKSLGHASASATEIYSRLSLDPVREAMASANKAMLTAMKKKAKQAALPAAKESERASR